MSDSTSYGLISVGVSSLLLALVVLIKRFNGLQFGTCCKISFSTPRQGQANNELEMPATSSNPVTNELIETVIVPVVDNLIRKMSKDDQPNKIDNLV